MKWRRVVIQTYRSIVKADLRLGEITVIIGASDVGKSSLVRALRDWAYNALGDQMITVGSTVARVAVALEDGPVVAWEHRGEAYGHGGAGSAYFVRRGGETAEYRKIGSDVPEEVRTITGVREVLVDDFSLRVQLAEQGDPWFLLASPPWTPGKVTKVVGRIAGLDSLVLANRALEKERMTASSEEKRLRVVAADQLRALGEYVGLDRALALVGQAQAALARADVARKRIQDARALLARMKARKDAAASARARVEELRPAVVRADRLGLEGLVDRLESARSADVALRGAETEVARARSVIAAERQELAATSAELKKIASSGDLLCPTCGGPLHSECRARIAEEAAR